MIDDILFGGTASGDTSDFLLEIPATVGGVILSYSLDGSEYDFISGGEIVSIIIN